MNLTLLLPWFPIILAVGVAGRLLGKARGIGIGIACALFWIVLAQAGSNHAVWTDPWIVVSLITGSLAIIAMGAWSADVALDGTPTAVNSTPTTSANAPRTTATTSAPDPRDGAPPEDLDWAFDQFNDWLETHRHDRNPWPAFDGFLRSVLNRCCGATHVKPYRVLTDSDELVPLTDADPLGNPPALSARGGILGHVSTTGRSFLADDPGHGEFVDRLARASSDPPAWCFAVRSGTCRIGVVAVGRLDIAPWKDSSIFGGHWSRKHAGAARRRSSIRHPESSRGMRFLPRAKRHCENRTRLASRSRWLPLPSSTCAN